MEWIEHKTQWPLPNDKGHFYVKYDSGVEVLAKWGIWSIEVLDPTTQQFISPEQLFNPLHPRIIAWAKCLI